MEKKHKKLLALTGLATTAVAAVAVTAVTGVPGAANAAGTQNCTVHAQTGEQRCFETFTEAIAFASGGTVTDAPPEAQTAATDTQLAAKLAGTGGPSLKAAGDVIQGTFFTDTNYGGNSLTITGKICEKDGYVNWQYDLPDDWKNQISSVQAWGNCSLWLYPEPNLSGDRDGPFDENTPDIGAFMNDRTQSIGFS